jgi:hypothetical protein
MYEKFAFVRYAGWPDIKFHAATTFYTEIERGTTNVQGVG